MPEIHRSRELVGICPDALQHCILQYLVNVHVFATLLPHFCNIFAKFDAIFVDFQRRRQILQISVKFSPFSIGISQNFKDFDRSDAKIDVFQRNVQKIAENLLQSEICSKKYRIYRTRIVYSPDKRRGACKL